VAKRKEITIRHGDDNAGVDLTFTRKGLEVFGWFDTYAGIADGQLIEWATIDGIRKKLEKVTPKEKGA